MVRESGMKLYALSLVKSFQIKEWQKSWILKEFSGSYLEFLFTYLAHQKLIRLSQEIFNGLQMLNAKSTHHYHLKLEKKQNNF